MSVSTGSTADQLALYGGVPAVRGMLPPMYPGGMPLVGLAASSHVWRLAPPGRSPVAYRGEPVQPSPRRHLRKVSFSPKSLTVRIEGRVWPVNDRGHDGPRRQTLLYPYVAGGWRRES
jgi:hypothetical protein